ncbi:TonB-dependent receptor [Sphingomicrobium sp. XHP0239]|uniref:TonB-dependent receptor n=1 Tax=Sphingomicrobium maritimum TaxID=3133972 RepID=UPI0031CCA2B6
MGAVANASFGATNLSAYAHSYDFRLVSNFTYFLEDPIDGDEFVQIDERVVLGGAASHRFDFDPVRLTVGADLRHDAIERVGLFESVDGMAVSPIRTDSIDQTGIGLYASAEVALTDRVRAIGGLRYDRLSYSVDADLAANSGDGSDDLFAPKASLAWRVLDELELYANYGQSFHSNDARGAAIAIDPTSGDPADPVPLLARAEGAELGARVERGTLSASLVGYWLELDSELVFVGDGGATEPNDGSRRYGIEADLFWQATDEIVLDAAYSTTDARFIGPPDGEDDIPGAVPTVVSAGIRYQPIQPLSFTARLRHFSSAPLIEDGSVTSDPTTLVNLGAYYELGAITLGAELFNAFDSEDADITYFYESRLADEPVGVEDRHFHPVEPRQLRFSIEARF